MTFAQGEQVPMFSHDSWCGKTYPELCPQTAEKTFAPSSKKPSESQIKPALFLDMRGERGELRGLSWETDGLSLGAYTTRSFGECPSVVVESRLSQILEENPPRKYFLSAKACRGILNRAKRRGKRMPEELEIALKTQAEDL